MKPYGYLRAAERVIGYAACQNLDGNYPIIDWSFSIVSENKNMSLATRTNCGPSKKKSSHKQIGSKLISMRLEMFTRN